MKSVFGPNIANWKGLYLLLLLLQWGGGLGLGLSVAPASEAAPWLESGNAAQRLDISRLKLAGHTTTLLTTWPLPLPGLLYNLEHSGDFLQADTQAAAQRILRRGRFETRSGNNRFFSLHTATQAAPFGTFATPNPAQHSLSLFQEGLNDWAAWRIRFTLAENYTGSEHEEHKPFYDGSWFAAVKGNWIFGVGAQNRWWGPGWNSSLILGHHARPIPSVWLSRNVPFKADSRAFSWLGAWHFETFIGQMDDAQRLQQKPWVWGMRWVAQPLDAVEVGLSRVLTMGGKGMDVGLDDFASAFLNNASGAPYNQLAGWDIRWSGKWLQQGWALYSQSIGESESGWGKRLQLQGIEWYPSESLLSSWRPMLYFEYSDTLCRSSSLGSVPGCAYNHSIYAPGHRYQGRPMGSPFDADAKVYSFGVMWHGRHERFWNVRVFSADLNRYNDPLATVPSLRGVNWLVLTHEWSLWRGRAAVELRMQNSSTSGYESLARRNSISVQWSTR